GIRIAIERHEWTICVLVPALSTGGVIARTPFLPSESASPKQLCRKRKHYEGICCSTCTPHSRGCTAASVRLGPTGRGQVVRDRSACQSTESFVAGYTRPAARSRGPARAPLRSRGTIQVGGPGISACGRRRHSVSG